MLPSGEAPGWTHKKWLNVEFLEANYWAAPSKFINTNTGKTLTFTSDYEQTTFFLEAGKEVSNKLAAGIILPVTLTHGGDAIDQFITGYHKLFHFDSFGRPDYPKGQTIFETSTDGVARRSDHAPSGIGNIQLKLKYWPIQWRRDTGLGVTFALKLPVSGVRNAMTSGSIDPSLLLHFAFPIGEESYFYSSIGASYVSQNWMFQDWPRRKFLWMTDLMFDLSISEKWGIILDQSFQAPFMKRHDLEFVYTKTTEHGKKEEKMASGFNSLAEIRGQQMIGFRRYINSKKNLWLIYFIEDWGFGAKDVKKDFTYSNNQPDVGIGTRFIFEI